METSVPDEGDPVRRGIERAVTPLVRCIEWLYGPRLPALDLGLGTLALGWASLMLAKPQVYAGGRFAGMSWMPTKVWVGLFCALVVLHALGCRKPDWRGMRGVVILLSAWIWLSVSLSFTRLEFSTASVVYFVVGFIALTGGIFIAGQPRNGG